MYVGEFIFHSSIFSFKHNLAISLKTDSHCSHWLHPRKLTNRRELTFVVAEVLHMLSHLILTVIQPGILQGKEITQGEQDWDYKSSVSISEDNTLFAFTEIHEDVRGLANFSLHI